MGTLYLVRHGETVWNQESRFQGQTDTELSPLGRAQAARVREALRTVALTIAYASDLRRARETAAIILDGREVPLYHLPELRERHWGEWESLTLPELEERSPESVARYWALRARFVPPGGEALDEVDRRIARFRERLVRDDPEAALVVAHGGVLRLLLCGFLGLAPEQGTRLRLDNCSVCRVELTPDRAIITSLNDICHLEGLGAED